MRKNHFITMILIISLCLHVLPIWAESDYLYEQDFESSYSEVGWNFKSAAGAASYAEVTTDVNGGGSRALKVVSKTKSTTDDTLHFDFDDLALSHSGKVEILFEFRVESFTRDFWRLGLLEDGETATNIYFRSSNNYALWQQNWSKYFTLGTQYQNLKYVIDAEGNFEVYLNGRFFETGSGIQNVTGLAFRTRDGTSWGSGKFNSDIDMVYWIDNICVREVPLFTANLRDENGKAVGQLTNYSGQTIRVEAIVDNSIDSVADYQVIFALKSKERLLALSCEKEQTYAEFILPESVDESCRIETYLWENKETIRPLEKRIILGRKPLKKIEYFVSASGTPNGTGIIDNPFNSWEQAQSAIRRLKNRDAYPEGGVTVTFRGGTYFTDGIVLDDKDSGISTAPVTWRSYPGESVTFTGGDQLNGESFYVSDDPRIPESAKGKVYVCSLDELGIEGYGTLPVTGHSQYYLNQKGWGGGGYYPLLTYNGKSFRIARYPNLEEGYAKIGTIYNYGFVGDKNEEPDAQMVGMSFSISSIDSARIERWSQAAKSGNLWAFGYWFYDWSDLTTPVASVDALNKSIITVLASPMGATGIRYGQPYYVYNLLEELDEPGEWFYDQESGELFLYPPQDEPIEDAKIEMVFKRKTLFSIKDAENITVQGFTFENVRGDGVTVSNSEHILLKNCVIKNVSGNGLGINGTEIEARHCTVEHVGARGIGVSGGNMETLVPSGNLISDCVVRDFATLNKMMTPGIYVDGVGQTIRNNLVEDGPQIGIRFGGNDHLIEYNIVRNVMKESSDGGAIYAGQSTTARGTVVRKNVIQNIATDRTTGHGIYGVYLDGRFSGTTVKENVFSHIGNSVIGGTAVFNHGGRNNTIIDNIITDTLCGITFAAVVDQIPSEDTSEFESIVTNPAYAKYPNFTNMLTDDYFEPKYGIVRDNVIFNVATPLHIAVGSRPVTADWIWQNNDLEEPDTVTEGMVTDIPEAGPRFQYSQACK